MEQGKPIETLVLSAGERLGSAVRRVGEAIAVARARGSRGLLVVVPEDLGAPTTAQRVEMVRQWARAADGRVRLAIVVPASMLDAERVGVVAAAGFGLEGESFSDEASARAWLEGGA